MTRDAMIEAVGREIVRTHPYLTEFGALAAEVASIVDRGLAWEDGGAVRYHPDVHRAWPRLPAPPMPVTPPAPTTTTPPAPTLEEELSAVRGSDDRSKAKRAAIRAAHIQKEMDR